MKFDKIAFLTGVVFCSCSASLADPGDAAGGSKSATVTPTQTTTAPAPSAPVSGQQPKATPAPKATSTPTQPPNSTVIAPASSQTPSPMLPTKTHKRVPVHVPAEFLKSVSDQAKKTYVPAPEFAVCKCSVTFELQKDSSIDHISVSKEPADSKGKTSPVATAALVTAVINLKLTKPQNVTTYPVLLELTFTGAKKRPQSCSCVSK